MAIDKTFAEDNFRRRLFDIDVIDGDTIAARVDLGFGLSWNNRGKDKKPVFRVLGIDTPETSRRGSWDKGLPEDVVNHVIVIGKMAKARTTQLIAETDAVYCWSPSWMQDSFGRILAAIFIKSKQGDSEYVMLSAVLLKEHLAVPFATRKTTTKPTTLLKFHGYEDYSQ